MAFLVFALVLRACADLDFLDSDLGLLIALMVFFTSFAALSEVLADGVEIFGAGGVTLSLLREQPQLLLYFLAEQDLVPWLKPFERSFLTSA